MPRPKTISDEDILAVARRCFQEHGHSMSTRDIAKEIGISQYQRFGGKEQMFLRAMIPEAPDLSALLDRPPGVSARAYLQVLTRRLIKHFEVLMPAVMHLMTYPGFDLATLGEAHEHLLARQLHDALTALFDALIDSGEMSGTSEGMATVVLGLAHTMGMHASMNRVPPRDEQVETAIDVLWNGAAP